MAFAELDDVLRPTDDTFKAFYEKGYRSWHKVSVDAADGCACVPPECLQWEDLFPHHPILPDGLEPDDSGLVTAKSTWISRGNCDSPEFGQILQMTLTIGKPTSVVLTDDPELCLSELGDGHLVVLILAWAYALSVRWAEIIPRASMEYTSSQAPWTVHSDPSKVDKHMVVELGELSGEEARWWAAVLSTGEDWKATIPDHRWCLLSPWSIAKNFNNTKLVLSGTHSPMTLTSPTSVCFKTALKYIDDYTKIHNTGLQSRAALAAALLLPLAKLDNRTVTLHTPKGSYRQSQQTQSPRPSLLDKHCLHQLDRLLNLSVNARGLKAVMGSIFYESGIPANACGAWLQGTAAVLQSKGTKNINHLSRMFFNRSPHISFLWLGGIITGAYKDFLRNTYSLLGLNRIELHAAAWTGTLLSFIQEPVHPIQTQNDTSFISRADECRLMFLIQEQRRDIPPIYPYPPLGETNIRDTDLGVQVHAYCPTPHELQFLSIAWNCVGGRKDIQTTGCIPPISRDKGFKIEEGDCEVHYTFLDRDRDLSEGVTRNMFTWMRDMDGFTVAEREICRHEWIDAFDSDSDDESVDPEGDGKSTTGPSEAQVGYWLVRSMTRRCDSI
ncbi:hypothetical protein FPSE_03723 [Fusarium pseudograminearum CS3096]|uniref:Uncharacterized protein n=1 Tax=Fusarium pseudograminearum (strain CS3096) TaxID=1028729 RepID=K3UU54_FUSPC|nr:hypothetical protein FPSE_03723 [Fusarium pseudograminearum CS3096]EKJ76091.1 hypothetical protein FPSE_03723 [Fusarium pseudograminearum CS3096]